ncbi:MAG: class I SAM-dependent RNA methyltransferase [Hyphomicrobiaceae bacterium]
MKKDDKFEMFLVTAPGLEDVLCSEVRAKGFNSPRSVPGGVTIKGGWPDVWRANLWIRGSGRVLAIIARFRALHLTDLRSRARNLPWDQVLRPEVPFRVEATCKKSRIYHSGAAAERIDAAIQEAIGASSSADAEILVRARIEHDMCTISVDTTGEPLHKRGYKEAISKAPMRETLASLLLYQCGYDGTEPVVDPMCGSGTFVIEAAEIAARLNPGRSRRFAFESLATFDEPAWQRMRTANSGRQPSVRCYGSDRDAGAIEISRANALRAGVAEFTEFRQCAISDATAPEGPPGLVMVNPPYGTRLGETKKLQALYRALGQTLMNRFAGWRVGIVTSDARLAKATGLPFLPTGAPIPHGGLKVRLFRTAPLA